MSTPMRGHVWYRFWGGLLVVGSLLGGGCTAGSPPVALEQARTAYAQAEQTPAVVTHASVPLREANQALRRAERVWADDPSGGSATPRRPCHATGRNCQGRGREASR